MIAGDAAAGDFRSLYDNAACGLLLSAEDGLLLQVNRTFCGWTGREPTDLIGVATLQSLFTMGGRIFHQTHMAPLLQMQGSVAEVKLEVLHRDGQRIPMMWNAKRVMHDGVVLHELAAVVVEDRHKYEQELRSARQRAEDALLNEREARLALVAAQVELERLRALAEDRAVFAEQMVAVVSHDLRNPLSVIHMGATLIGMSGPLSERQGMAMMQITNSTNRALRLIADLLDFSQARIGRGLRIDRVPLDLHAVIAQSVGELQVAFPGRTLIHVNAGEGLCAASADRLTQLVGNLVSNAVAYGAPGQPIIITSTVAADTFCISVHNEGPPIPEGLLPTLFEPMTRGQGETPAHSIGLGLYIVQQIAQAHGGEVTVQSGTGSGTTFTAILARGTSAATVAPPEPSKQEQARQRELDRLQVSAMQDAAYDEIVRLAADAFDMPIALISLVDGDRQWFKARVGLAATETPREYAFCAHAIVEADQVMMVEDAAADARFEANPLVTDRPGIRFYAGAPLVTASGHALGTLCVIDTKPRRLDEKQLRALQLMAQGVVTMMERGVQSILRRAPGDEAGQSDG